MRATCRGALQVLLVQNCSTLRANTKRIVLVSTSGERSSVCSVGLTVRKNCSKIGFVLSVSSHKLKLLTFSGIPYIYIYCPYSFLKDTIKVLCNSNHRIVNRMMLILNHVHCHVSRSACSCLTFGLSRLPNAIDNALTRSQFLWNKIVPYRRWRQCTSSIPY